MMNQDEAVSGVNGRLRPRKTTVSDFKFSNRILRRSDDKNVDDKAKKGLKPSQNETIFVPTLPSTHFLCPYCDKKFTLKQSLSKHTKRSHFYPLENDVIVITCQFCDHYEENAFDILKHMVDKHDNIYFACFDCKIRFSTSSELAEHKTSVCKKRKSQSIRSYRDKLRQRCNPSISRNVSTENEESFMDSEDGIFPDVFKSIVISCELKPTEAQDTTDIENNITANVILPQCKNVGNKGVLAKNTVVLLDNIQWNKKLPPSFSFRNNDADQILSRLGVVHRSPRTGESTKREWYRNIEDVSKFEKCFDSTFYSKVSRNVNENLSKFLDGTLNRFNSEDIIAKTRKSKGIVSINTIEGFPILLAPKQFSRVVFEGYIPRMITSKHKFKWDGNENDRLPLSVQSRIGSHTDPHVNECIITLVSRLDIGTQLCMRRKFEKKFNNSINSNKVDSVGIELKEILESREIPTSSQFLININRPIEYENVNDFPNYLGLIPSTPKYNMQPSVLSGEWARPRRYVCCACGDQTEDPKTLALHISNQHPNAQVSHYEIVGELLLNADILKHLYVPPSHSGNRSRPVRGSKECTKCKKPITLEEFHQHMLECAGDTPIARRKCRYRPFGVRRRRPRLPDNRIRKQIRKELRNRQSRQKKRRPRPRPRNRSEVGDGETIRKMLADLPAKRHRAAINPANTLRPRRKLEKPRNKICLRRRIPEVPKRKLRNAEAIDGDTKSEKNDDKPIIKCKQMFLKSKSSRIRRNTSIKPKPVPLKKVTRSSNSHQCPIIGTETALASRTEPLNSSNSDSDSVQNIEKLSLNNDSNRININNATPNKKECSTQHGSNYRDSQNPSCDQNKGDLSKKSTPQKVPLKHSIERLTANTDSSDRAHRFQYNYLMNHEFIQSFTQNAHHLHDGHKPLFENEAVIIKLDKPPLLNTYSKSDYYTLQKCHTVANKNNKPRKGLNDCIAMLKNKLDPVPGTSSSREEVVPESMLQLQNTEENPVSVLRTNFEQPVQDNNILPAHITTSQWAMTPLDLSGKSQRLVNEDNYTEEATNLCTKDNAHGSLSEPKEMYETLDLSTKGPQSHEQSQLAIINEHTSQQNANIDFFYIKHEETTLDLSMKSSTVNNMCANGILDLTSKTATSDNEYLDLTAKQSVSDSILHTKMITAPADRNTSEFKEHSDIDKIPQYKIRTSGTADTEKNPKNSDSEAYNVDILPKEIVEMLYTMPVQHRNTLLNVLPQVLAKTVKDLKLVADPSSSKEFITSYNKSEIATQTSGISLQSICPPEFLNIDTNKFLIDPCTGALTERKQSEDIDSHPPCLEKVIDLTLDERASNASLNKVLQNTNLINPIGIDTVHNISKDHTVTKPKGSSEQTASLRAVRIKSSTDKSKIFKAENNVLLFNTTVSNERKCNFNEFVDKNVAGLSIAKTTLAIQQAEITSTQQNSCQKKQSTVISTNEPKNYFNSKSPNNVNETAIVDAGIQEQNTALNSSIINIAPNTNSKTEMDIPPDVKIFTNVNADDINVTKENISVPNLKDNVDCRIPQKIVNNKSIEQELSEMTNIQGSSLQSSTQELMGNLKIPILSKQLDDSDTDDDEEDNISLAVIVKQKQLKNESALKSQNMKSIVNSQSPESSTLLHREDKLRRKIMRTKPNKPTLVLAVSQAVEEINNTFENHDFDTNDDKKIASPPMVQLYRPVDPIDVCVYGKKSPKWESQKSTNENVSNDKKNESTDISYNSENACSADQKKTFAIGISKKIIEHDNSLQFENKNESNNINVVPEIFDNDKPELRTKENTNNTTTKCLKTFKSSLNNEQEERVTATFENEQLPSDSLAVKNVSCETPPLRRSRRGKSSNIDNEIVNKPQPVIVVENKTPLTKKQLIFSKLLLDEENLTKLAQMKSIASDNIPKQSDTDAVNVHNLIQNPKETTVVNCLDDLNSKGQKANSPLKQKMSMDLKLDECHNNDLEGNEAKKKQQLPNIVTNIDQPCMESLQFYIDSNEQQELIQKAKKKQCHNDVTDIGQLCIPLCNNFQYPPVTETVTSAYYQSLPVQGSSKYPDFITGLETYRLPHLSVTINPNHTITDKDLIYHNEQQSFENRLPKRKSPCYYQTENISKPKKVKIIEPVIVNNEEDTTFASTFDDYLHEYRQRTSIYKLKRRKTRSQPVDMQIPSSSYMFHGKFGTTFEKNQDSVFQISHKPHTCTSSQYSTGNFNMNFNVAHGRDNPDIHDDNAVNGNDNDDYSDDSSRCDEPLRKLVGEISKNSSQANDSFINMSACEQDEDIQNENDINSRRTLAMCNNVEKTLEEAAEEELKSQQFMESFGFFSERKPRKSNLIATKRISETFHSIANESDDVYFSNNESRSPKIPSEDMAQNENKNKMSVASLDDDSTSSSSQASPSRKSTKDIHKKKEHKPVRPYCDICSKEFRRWDNLYRHKQLSLYHIARLSQLEKRFNTLPFTEGPNYLVVYKKRLEKLKKLTDQLNNERLTKGENATLNNTILPTFEEIMADMSKLTRESAKNESRRGLSCDEELFLDCCELLKESHKNDNPNATAATISDIVENEQIIIKPFDTATHEVISQLPDDSGRVDNKNEEDLDSLTAKTILESEEVRNLENDLISGLKEAVSMSGSHHVMIPCLNISKVPSESLVITTEIRSDPLPLPLDLPEPKQVKEKAKVKNIFTEVDDFNMFEDKFDKIKRKCRSQAAAAKQVQQNVETKHR